MRAVLAHDLADHAARVEAGEPRDVDRGLGMAGADQHAAGPGDQREDVAGRDDRFGAVGCIDGDGDGAGAVGGADAGGNALRRLDRDGEGGLVRLRLVRVIGSSPSWSARSLVSARQIRPRPCRAMKLIASGVAICAGMTRSPSFSRSSSSTRMNIRPLRASLMIASAPTSTSAVPRWISFSSRPSVSAVGFQSGWPSLRKRIGMKAGGAGKAGAADLAGLDDGFEPFDQGGAHGARYITSQCDGKQEQVCS